MIHGNWEESYVKLPKLLGALQSCVPETVVAAQTEFVHEGGEIVPGKRLFKRVFWSFGPCINGFAYCKPIVQVNGTWLYEKYTGTLLIATSQDGTNHIFPIAYAIVERETTSAWGFFLKNLRRHVTPQMPTTTQVTYESRTHAISFVYATLHKTFFAVTHTHRRCTGDILGISVQISLVQLNGLINYPNKNEYNVSMRGNVGDI
ncbi:hypothetical protein GmHk_01G000729 [Glycine max]|nr:hypothetical protein GmHk_01G000729 [Glycine max]